MLIVFHVPHSVSKTVLIFFLVLFTFSFVEFFKQFQIWKLMEGVLICEKEIVTNYLVGQKLIKLFVVIHTIVLLWHTVSKFKILVTLFPHFVLWISDNCNYCRLRHVLAAIPAYIWWQLLSIDPKVIPKCGQVNLLSPGDPWRVGGDNLYD